MRIMYLSFSLSTLGWVYSERIESGIFSWVIFFLSSLPNIQFFFSRDQFLSLTTFSLRGDFYDDRPAVGREIRASVKSECDSLQ